MSVGRVCCQRMLLRGYNTIIFLAIGEYYPPSFFSTTFALDNVVVLKVGYVALNGACRKRILSRHLFVNSATDIVG